jgi:hypothetical protein
VGKAAAEVAVTAGLLVFLICAACVTFAGSCSETGVVETPVAAISAAPGWARRRRAAVRWAGVVGSRIGLASLPGG